MLAEIRDVLIISTPRIPKIAGHGLKKSLKAAVEDADNGKGAIVFGYYVDAQERFGIDNGIYLKNKIVEK